MRHDKLERELQLILLLTENYKYSIDELCGKVGISRRNLYYYLEFLRDSGFKVQKRGTAYFISRDSPFFNHLLSRISFTEEEAVQIGRLLDKAERGNPLITSIKKKLERFYDFEILADEELREQAVHNISVLYDAIKMHRQAVLHGYASPHSQTTRDRYVEPFLLMNNNNEVRCYEPATGMNKTFKVSRMQGVEMLDTEWEYEKHHRQVFTDVFMFSGEVLLPVELYLGQLSYNVLMRNIRRRVRWLRLPLTDAGTCAWTCAIMPESGVSFLDFLTILRSLETPVLRIISDVISKK